MSGPIIKQIIPADDDTVVGYLYSSGKKEDGFQEIDVPVFCWALVEDGDRTYVKGMVSSVDGNLVFADEGKPGSDRTEILGYGRQSILDKQRGGDPGGDHDDDLKDAADPS